MIEFVNALRANRHRRLRHQRQRGDGSGEAKEQEKLGCPVLEERERDVVHLVGSGFGTWIRMPGASLGAPINSMPADSRL